MLNTTSRLPRVHWRLLGVAAVALAVTVIVGMLEVVPSGSSSPSELGTFVSGAIMIVALVVFIGCIMFVLSEFLRSEEYAERAYVRAAPGQSQGGSGYAAGAGPFMVSRRAQASTDQEQVPMA